MDYSMYGGMEMKFGEFLRELLEDNDITQKQLAADLNLAPTTIGNYIRCFREPDFAILKLFATYFNVTTDYLLDFKREVQRIIARMRCCGCIAPCRWDKKRYF